MRFRSQKCHTDKCPVGVATQSEARARALDVGDKSMRVKRYQEATVKQAASMMATLGATRPEELSPHMLRRNIDATQTQSYYELYEWLSPGQLLAGAPQSWIDDWDSASADRFVPQRSHQR